MQDRPDVGFQFSVTRMFVCVTLVFVSLAMTLSPPKNIGSTGIFDRDPWWLVVFNLAGPAVFGFGFGLLWRRPIVGAAICSLLFWAGVGILFTF